MTEEPNVQTPMNDSESQIAIIPFYELANGSQFTLPDGHPCHGDWFRKIASNMYERDGDNARTPQMIQDPATLILIFT
jgi:hypothetical protein